MYDSVEVSQIPATAEAVAGYVGGKWPTFNVLVQRFPHTHRLSIAVNASEDADCLDVETGDATPAEAPAWFRRQIRLGKTLPCFYANSSTMPAVIAALTAAGIPRNQYRVWSAHYTGVPHIQPGSDATQWYDKALGRNLDISWCKDTFFGTVADTWQPNDEVNWCREWDKILARKTLPAHLRRLYLRSRMLLRRRAITRASYKSGWRIANRLYRYKQLQKRSG
jgi:hypothetical protein